MSSRSARPPGRSANIFINYRRDDSAGHAGRLFDGLSGHFSGRLFMDVDTIAPGVDFVDAIEKAVGSCEVLIVVIGQDWLTVKNAAGQRRIDDSSDFVRLELETALARNIRVIPVLVQGAEMPCAEELPPSLARLARRNAIELSDVRWSYDVNRLVQTIQAVLGEEAAAPTPAEPKRRDLPISAPAGTAAGPRPWLYLLAIIVSVSAVVLASVGWRSSRESVAAAGSTDADVASPANVSPAYAASPGSLAETPPAPAPSGPQSTGVQAVNLHPEPVRQLVPRPPVASQAEETTAANRSGSPAAIPLPEPLQEVRNQRTAPEEAGAHTAENASRAESLHLPQATITAPRDGTKVGKRVTAKGVITGLGAGQRAFLCIKNRKEVTYPRAELSPGADGRWSAEIESSHHDYEIFVAITTSPAGTEVLTDRANQEHGLPSFPPQGASIVGPVVSLKRQGKVADLLNARDKR